MRTYIWWIIAVVLVAYLVGIVVIIARLPMPYFDREREECDRQMAILMATRDPVDLARAEFLIYQLDCRIGSRLPPIDAH